MGVSPDRCGGHPPRSGLPVFLSQRRRIHGALPSGARPSLSRTYGSPSSLSTLAEIINEGFKTTTTKEDITRVEVRMDRIEHLLLADQKREIEDLKQRMKRLEDALAI